MPTIHLDHVAKVYKSRGRNKKTAAILNIELEIEQGAFIFFVGSRGSGKSTLLNLIAGEIEPDRGAIYFDGENIEKMFKRGRTGRELRDMVGLVPQESMLVRADTVLENMLSKSVLSYFKNKMVYEPRMRKALALVGMPDVEERRVLEFPYSSRRRIELAKAILKSPPVLLLDELTERVDRDTAWDLMQLLNELNSHGTTILMATHDRETVNLMRKRVITLRDGKIVGNVPRGRFGDIV